MKASNKPFRKSADLLSLERRGYQFGKRIGKGSYGQVVRANYAESGSGDKLELACKFVDKTKAPKDFLDKFFPRELELLAQVNHPNIIDIHSILQSGSTVFIFMRYAENGDLLDFIKNHGAISEAQAKLWFFQMVSAVRYLHQLGYAHRDLKCENILVSRHMNVKLADFGFTRKCVDENDKKIMSSTHCGSAAYAAPEVVNGKAYDPMKSDVWSLGVILFIVINSAMPFDDSNLSRLIRDQKDRNYHFDSKLEGNLSADCKTTLHALLEPNPKTRCCIDEVHGMKWLRKHVEKHSTLFQEF